MYEKPGQHEKLQEILALPDIKIYFKVVQLKSLVLVYEETDQWKRIYLNTNVNLVYFKCIRKD